MLNGPFRDARFAELMAPLGPFEPEPHIAVAVSGGADSMALAVLADSWARARGGQLTAYVVDHALVPGSDMVSRDVAETLAARGIAARVLTSDAPVPAKGVEAFARAVRYRLLRRACHGAGVLHLLIGHTRDDQAETLLLRLGAGSAADGLAAMSPVVEWPEVRVLRPLLAVARTDVRAVAEAAGVTPWDDPMNADRRFRRVRVRHAAGVLADAGLTAIRLAEAADGFARARASLEGAAARAVARTVRLFPQGYAAIDVPGLLKVDADVRARAIARVLGAVGGQEYVPSPSRADRLFRRLISGDIRASLGGCVVERYATGLRVFRECRGAPVWETVAAGEMRLWDGRFPVTAPENGAVRVRRAGRHAPAMEGVPYRARAALPWAEPLHGASDAVVGPFRPRLSLCGPGAYVVDTAKHTI